MKDAAGGRDRENSKQVVAGQGFSMRNRKAACGG